MGTRGVWLGEQLLFGRGAAGTKSWKAFFFGSSDASNFITVDKPPAAFWAMELSARAFGVNAWSILVPQALEGVATVAVVYGTVRRWFSPAAGLIAGAVLALTPVAALMFRYNNPDALLVLVLSLAAYATVRALEDGRTRWLVLAGSLVGLGFLTKMLQALVVVPVFAAIYLLAGPPRLGQRVKQLLLAGVALVVSGGWWVAVVQLTPAADRPYVGGSQDNSLFNLIFGYNGFGRLTGNEAGSVGGGAAPGSRWGPTGWSRLFGADMGGQISWLIPAALVLAVACLCCVRRAPRTDRTRAAVLLWVGWLVLTGALFSFAQGIIHPYYTVALAPALGALVGIGAVALWQRGTAAVGRVALGPAVGTTAIWAFVLLDRTPSWVPPLRWVVLAVGLAAAAGVGGGMARDRRVALALGLVALAVRLAAPAAFAIDTAATTHSGAIPSAGPALSGAGFGPGAGQPGPGSPGGAGGLPGLGGSAQRPGAAQGPGAPGAAAAGQGGASPGANKGARGNPAGAGGGAAVGGLLSSSTPSTALVRRLERGAGRYTWVAATIGSNSAAGYQLATGDPVMAIGGFNGTDPAPTLTQFEAYVRAAKIHFFIAQDAGGAGGGTVGGVVGGTASGRGAASVAGTTSDAAAITQWVQSHFTPSRLDGVTLYDLSTSLPPGRVLTRGFWLAFVSSLCYFSGIGVVLPVLPVYIAHHLHGNDLTVGIVVGIFAASAVLARPIAGRLGNRLGRRLLMVLGAVVVGLSLVFYGIGGIAVLVLLRLMTGAGEGLYFTGSTTLVADLAPPDRRAQVLSYFSVALFTGLGAGPLLGQAIESHGGATEAFVVAGALALVGALVATQVPRSGIAADLVQPTSHFLNRKAIGPGLVLTLGIVGITAFQAYTPLYVETLHMGGPEFVFLLYAVVVLVTRIIGAPLSDRVGVIQVASAATVLIVVGLGVLALWGTAAGLYVGTVPFALGISLQYPALMTMVVNRLPAHERSSAVGTFTTAFDLSQGASGVVLGVVAALAGFRTTFAAAAGFALVGLIVFRGWVARPTTPIPGQIVETERDVLADPDAWLPPGAD